MSLFTSRRSTHSASPSRAQPGPSQHQHKLRDSISYPTTFTRPTTKGGPGLSGVATGGGGRSTIPFMRSRIHPLLLVPVFLLGCYLSPWLFDTQDLGLGRLGGGGGSGGEPGFFEPQVGKGRRAVNAAGKQRYEPRDVFLPPDAPPLEGKGKRTGDRFRPGESNAADDDSDDGGEWWSFGDDDGSELEPTPGSATPPPYHLERDGYLYYSTQGVPVIPMTIPRATRRTTGSAAAHQLDLQAQIARAQREAIGQAAGSTDRRPPVPEWPEPGHQFQSPEERGHYKASNAQQQQQQQQQSRPRVGAGVGPVGPARGLADRGQQGPAAGGGGAGPAAAFALAQRRREQAALRAQRERQAAAEAEADADAIGPNGVRLGPNAIAMRKAKAEGRVFRPGRPGQFIMAEREAELEQQRREREEARNRNARERAGRIRERLAGGGGGAGAGGAAGIGGKPIPPEARVRPNRPAVLKEAAKAAVADHGQDAQGEDDFEEGPGEEEESEEEQEQEELEDEPLDFGDEEEGIDEEGDPADDSTETDFDSVPALDDDLSHNDEANAEDDPLMADVEKADRALVREFQRLTPNQRAVLSKNDLQMLLDLEAKYAGGNKRGQDSNLSPEKNRMLANRRADRARPFEGRPPPEPKKPVFKGMQGGGIIGGGGERERMRKRSEIVESAGDERRADESRQDEHEGGTTSSEVEGHPSVQGDESSRLDDQAALDTLRQDTHKLTRRAVPDIRPRDRIHPIPRLIAEAEAKWEDMLRKQSQTLEQAVVEYTRRYKRKPPLGFDKWWRYAMENRVILVDEYDQINEDIEPFLAIPSKEVQARAKAVASDPALPFSAHAFTLTINDGGITANGPHAKSPKSEDLQDLMGDFIEVLPDISLTFAEHEGPSVPISGKARQLHTAAAREQRVLSKEDLNNVHDDPGFSPWQTLCPPNSTAQRLASGKPVEVAPQAPSFVSAHHEDAMDQCLHPEIQQQQGFTAWQGPRPYLLYPLFSWSKTRGYGDLLCPPLAGYYDEVGRDKTWEQKKSRLYWRGPSSGAWHGRGTAWRSSQRARLVQATNDAEGERSVTIADPAVSESIRQFTGPARDVLEYYFDVAYSGKPEQCDMMDGTCDLLQQVYRFSDPIKADEDNDHKYILDVDGNGKSETFHRSMRSRSLVFKSTIFPEWWSKRVVPWYHYVPIKSDYSDLLDVTAFFIGAPDGTASHDFMAKKLADNGKRWAEEHWREADMAAYLFRLYLEYSRALYHDGEGSHDYSID